MNARGLALVDRVRRLPRRDRAALRAFLAERPGALASLRFAFGYRLDERGRRLAFWGRGEQLVTEEELAARPRIVVFFGLRRSGKTRAAVELLLWLIRLGIVRRPRLIAAHEADAWGTLVHGTSGILACLPAWEQPELCPSSREYAPGGHIVLPFGHGGRTVVRIYSAASIESPTGSEGDGDLYDDLAKWTAAALRAYKTARISCSMGRGIGIVATSAKGLRLLRRVMAAAEETRGESVLEKPLTPGGNAGNLTAGHAEQMEREFGADALEDEETNTDSPFASFDFDAHRSRGIGRPSLLGVGIDPATSAMGYSCRVGVVGGLLGERSCVHITHDRSRIMDASPAGWPGVAWDLAELLMRMFPGVPFRFTVEINKGGNMGPELLRAEERRRRLERKEPGVSTVVIHVVKADTSKTRRAQEPAMIGEAGQLLFAEGLEELEGELRNLRDDGTKTDAADAAVHLANDLAGLGDKAARAAAEAEALRVNATEQCAVAAQVTAGVNSSRAVPLRSGGMGAGGLSRRKLW